MDLEPLALDTRKPSKRMDLNGPFPKRPGSKRHIGSKRPISKTVRVKTAHYQNGPLNHLTKVPTFEIMYRAKDPDVEMHVHNFGTRCNKDNINL